MGGLEVLLMQIMRRMDRQRFAFDILTQSQHRPHFADELHDLGVRLHTGPPLSRPLAFARRFRQIIKNDGPFEALHCHLHRSAAPVLLLARMAGVPIRVVHSHNDLRERDAHLATPQRLAHAAARAAIRHHATHHLAVSSRAAASLYGPDYRRLPRLTLLPPGIDFTPFQQAVDPSPLRRQLRIPTDALVVGHVGRFAYAKNHPFLLEIAQTVLKNQPDAHFVFVGDGPDFHTIRRQIQERKLEHRVHLLGARTDVPELMNHVFDIFLFPSLHEGLGIVLIEAQAAGLPCLTADTIPDEARVIPELFHTYPLAASADDWAQELVRIAPRRMPACDEALRLCEQSHFAMRHSIEKLTAVYAASRAA